MNEHWKKNRWEVCPICLEEWSKLKKCRFKWNGKWVQDSLCVQCGETTKSIRRIAEMFPVPEFEINTGFVGIWRAGSVCGKVKDENVDEIIPEKIYETQWRNHYATISCGALVIGITATVGETVLIKIGDEEPRHVDNILAAWSIASESARNLGGIKIQTKKQAWDAGGN